MGRGKSVALTALAGIAAGVGAAAVAVAVGAGSPPGGGLTLDVPNRTEPAGSNFEWTISGGTPGDVVWLWITSDPNCQPPPVGTPVTCNIGAQAEETFGADGTVSGSFSLPSYDIGTWYLYAVDQINGENSGAAVVITVTATE